MQVKENQKLLANLSLFSAVIIDDNKSDATNLLWGLQQVGVVCTPLIYDGVLGLQGANVVSKSEIRFVFLDLNLTPGVGGQRGSSDLAIHITEALKSLCLSGPYVLFVWSDIKVLNPVEVIGLAISRGAGYIPLPVGVELLDKDHYIKRDEQGGIVEFANADVANKMQEVLCRYPQLLAMMSWESRVHNSAGRVTNKIFSITGSKSHDDLLKELSLVVGEGQTSEEDNKERERLYEDVRLAALLVNVAKGALGQQVPGKEASSAEAGLYPLLEDQLCFELAADADYCKIWQRALNPNKISVLSDDDKSLLNTALLIDSTNSSNIERGVLYDITEFEGVDELILRPIFNISLENIAKDIFIQDKDSGGLKKDVKDAIDEAVKKCRVGLLTYSASCDYAQSNDVIKKVFLCATIKETYVKRIRKDGSLKKSPVIKMDSPSRLLISFRYVSGIHAGHVALLTDANVPSVRIRDQLLAEIANEYAAFLSRPGLISL